jgi:hypothetical protein
VSGVALLEMMELASQKRKIVLDKTHCLLGADFSQGSCLDPLSELVDRDKQVGQAPRRFLEGSQKIQAPHGQMTM